MMRARKKDLGPIHRNRTRDVEPRAYIAGRMAIVGLRWARKTTAALSFSSVLVAFSRLNWGRKVFPSCKSTKKPSQALKSLTDPSRPITHELGLMVAGVSRAECRWPRHGKAFSLAEL